MIMFSLQFTVAGRPAGKQIRRGKWGQVYVDKNAREFMDRIKLSLRTHPKIQEVEKHKELPVSVTIISRFKVAQSLSEKEKKERINSYHIFKPDEDNIKKCVYDAMKGIAWKDDCQVFASHTRKEWANYDGIDVIVNYMEMPLNRL